MPSSVIGSIGAASHLRAPLLSFGVELFAGKHLLLSFETHPEEQAFDGRQLLSGLVGAATAVRFSGGHAKYCRRVGVVLPHALLRHREHRRRQPPTTRASRIRNELLDRKYGKKGL